jgi:MFS family permease
VSPNKFVDAIFSFLLFICINVASIYIIFFSEDPFWDVNPVLVIAIYIIGYILSLIVLFGYRVRHIGSVLILSTLFGKKVELEFNDIIYLRPILDAMYILKTNRRKYLIWITMISEEVKSLNELARKMKRD